MKYCILLKSVGNNNNLKLQHSSDKNSQIDLVGLEELKKSNLDYKKGGFREIYGNDPRVYSISGKEFLRNDDGTLKGIKTVEVDQNFQEIPGTEKDWEADLILLAMGFLGPEQYTVEGLDLETDERSNYKAEHNVHQTSDEKIFAAGDCRRGQSLVVWAINEGRAAAREIDRHLMGVTSLK